MSDSTEEEADLIIECLTEEEITACLGEEIDVSDGEGIYPLDAIEGPLGEKGFSLRESVHLETKRWGPLTAEIYQAEDGRTVAWQEYRTEMETYFYGWISKLKIETTQKWTIVEEQAS
jgi:hypothetical protein